MKFTREKQLFFLMCVSFLFLFASSVCAQNMQAIKAQMLERKPTIDVLKDKGIVGEGNDGYLHFRQKSDKDNPVVNAENADRRKVNEAIAKKEGTTVDQVSKKVAVTIIANSKAGHWVQKEDGTWYQK